jgi:hypothetical protein
LIAAAAALALCWPASAPAASPALVPRGFVGVTTSPPLLLPAVRFDDEARRMRAAGVESIRTPMDWGNLQPYRNTAAAPPDFVRAVDVVEGVPTDFRPYDPIVLSAAKRGLEVLPFVIGATRWVGRKAPDTPTAVRGYTRLLRALVGRYGPRGTLWAENLGIPKRPIRYWQIWNEYNLNVWWPRQPFPAGVVRLLRASRQTIRRLDPGARIVLGGLPNFSWRELARIYRARGRGTFDVVAIHPFTLKGNNVVRIARLIRAVTRRYHQPHMPIWVTELSWPAARGKTRFNFTFDGSPALQAARIRTTFPALARQRRSLGVERVFWETWMTEYKDRRAPFDYTGLRKIVISRDRKRATVSSMPGLTVFARTARRLEGCAALAAKPCR